MDEQSKPDAAQGWYPDPDQAQTQRYWDGRDWTDQVAPMTSPPRIPNASSKLVVGLILAGLGAVAAIVAVFLPLADTESSIHIAKNSMIQHWEGGVVIGVAIVGFLLALRDSLRPLCLLAGAGLIAIAVICGTNLPITYRNEFSEAVAGNVSPGAGVWTVGVGGALMAAAALFGDWTALGDGFGGTKAPLDEEQQRKRSERRLRWNEIMSGESYDRSDEDVSVDESVQDEENGQ